MGQKPSLVQSVSYSAFADTLLTSEHWRGFEIDRSLQRFSFLNSTDELNYFREQLIVGDDLSAATNTLEKVSLVLGSSAVPNAVGLGALIIAIIMDMVAKTLNKKTHGTAEMMDRVFAQERDNEVRDLMAEYLKRLQINLGNPELLLADTQRKEWALSAQLTRLRNSMNDGHMSTDFLKQWVNGAAFHTQMLIHQARLERTLGTRASRAAELYQQQLDRLLREYKKYLKTVIFVGLESSVSYGGCILQDQHFCQINYIEYSRRTRLIVPFPTPDQERKAVALIEEMFGKPQFTSAKTYFSELQTTIPMLVLQNTTFYL